MLWFILATGACNLSCQYCGGGFPPEYSPPRPEYKVEDLVDLIERTDSRPVVFFYGGEPLVNAKLIVELVDLLGDKAVYGIQTNGILYRRLSEEYWAKFRTVLLSIDGRESITDAWRGKGVYGRVVEALGFLKSVRKRLGGPETIIARMTATRDTRIDIDVLHLLKGLGFDKIHWQIDAVWSEEWPVGAWAREHYLPRLVRLARWVALRVKERLWRIVPFHGVVSALYNGGYNWAPCGAGRSAIAVNTDGRILACPVAVREKWATVGRLGTGFKRVNGGFMDECMRCGYYPLCGGRCLYAQVEKNYWSMEKLWELDWATRRTIDIIIKVVVPAVEKAIERGELGLGDLSYDPLLESTEVIP